jgi:hypothetical protein
LSRARKIQRFGPSRAIEYPCPTTSVLCRQSGNGPGNNSDDQRQENVESCRRGTQKSLADRSAGTCSSGREVAERSDVMITMVPDMPHVEAALSEGLSRAIWTAASAGFNDRFGEPWPSGSVDSSQSSCQYENEWRRRCPIAEMPQDYRSSIGRRGENARVAEECGVDGRTSSRPLAHPRSRYSRQQRSSCPARGARYPCALESR